MATDTTMGQTPADSGHPQTRRDFITTASLAWAGVGGAIALWPFIQQMNPDASTQALSTTEVDISPLKEGQAITILWQGKPVFIRNRTPKEIQEAEEVKPAELKDEYARNADLPDRALATDANRIKKGEAQWLVLIGICTHLGCIPKGQSLGDARGEFGGYFCPCHGSQYDTSGRIRKGPAPENLAVPPYQFLTPTKIKIG